MPFNDLRPKPREECRTHDAQLTQPVVVGDRISVRCATATLTVFAPETTQNRKARTL